MPNKSIQQFDQELEEKNLQGLWNEALWKSDAKLMTKDPKTMVLPCVWKGEDIYGYLTQAGDLVGLGGKVERRTIRLLNPGLKDFKGQKHATTHTMHMSVQLLKPGEHASSHRHNFGAFRFVDWDSSTGSFWWWRPHGCAVGRE